jgi:hypothetical protein
MTTAIDTLKLYERLRTANFDEKAARELAEVFKEVVEDRLVTKKDLDEALAKTRAEITSEIIKWVAAMLVAQAAAIAALVKLLP